MTRRHHWPWRRHDDLAYTRYRQTLARIVTAVQQRKAAA